MPSSLSVTLLLGVATTSAGCTPTRGSWWITFASSADAARATSVEVSIVEGGCSGDHVLFDDRFAGSSGVMSPPVLAPGSYGFRARARDASCDWFASGCVDVTLPGVGVITELVATTVEHDATCSLDAGIADGGARDAASAEVGVDARHDVGVDVGADAGHDAAVVDAGHDAAVVDAGHDAAVVDAGHDAAVLDAGHDAAVVDAGSTRPACSVTFATIPGLVLCTETATTCRFYTTADGSCTARCALVGATCLGAENDDSAGAACDSLGASTCTSSGTDGICICSR